MLRKYFLIVGLILGTGMWDLNVQAEDQVAQEKTVIGSESFIKYIPSRKQDNGSGSMSIVEAGTEQSFELKAFRVLPVSFAIDTKYIGLNEATDRHFPGYLTTAGLDVETTFPVLNSDKVFLSLGMNPSFFSDTWDFTADSFRMPLRAVGIYKSGDKFVIVAGGVYYPGFENNLFPIIGVIYKPNEKLTLNLVSENPNIVYAVNPRTDLFVEANAYLDEEFNTTRQGEKNVVLEYREVTVAGGVKRKINSRMDASFSVGEAMDREIKYKGTPEVILIKNSLYTELKFNVRI